MYIKSIYDIFRIYIHYEGLRLLKDLKDVEHKHQR